MDKVFHLAQQPVFSKFENHKKANNFTRIDGEAYPVILSMQNHSNRTISEIAIDVFLKIGKGTNHMFHEPITDSGITIEPDNLTHDILLLDMSGFPITYVEVERLTYKSGTESFTQEPMELQFVIDTAMVGNSFIGFDSAEELAKYHLLGNYLKNSLPARTFLLQNSFGMLSEIASGEIHLDGRMQKLGESDRRKWLGAIQIDIISKIMMQMEDLIGTDGFDAISRWRLL